MALVFANNAVSVLPASVLLTDTTISVTATHGARFPALTAGNAFIATIQNGTAFEIIRVTARSGDVLTVVRGQEGTAAQTWAAGSTINMRFTKGTAEAFAQREELVAAAPIGHMVIWPSNTPPAKFLFCNGAAISRVTYAALFAVIGTTFGAGDGVNTFNLPDLRGRVPVGRDDMGSTSANRVSAILSGTVLGASGGSAALHQHSHGVTDPGHIHLATDSGHTHAVSDPGHNHSVNDPGHAHSYYTYVTDFAAGLGGTSALSQFQQINTSANFTGIYLSPNTTGVAIVPGAANISVASNGTGITVSAAGTGDQQNIQPSIIMNYVIYAGV